MRYARPLRVTRDGIPSLPEEAASASVLGGGRDWLRTPRLRLDRVSRRPEVWALALIALAGLALRLLAIR